MKKATMRKFFASPEVRGWIFVPIASIAVLITVSARGATLTWNPGGSGTGGTDGAGTWSAPSSWYDGTGAVSWTSGSDATFGSGGIGGSVALASAQSVNTVTFANSGYVLTGGPLAIGFNGGSNNFNLGASVIVTDGVSAEIDSAFSGANVMFQASSTTGASSQNSSLTLKGGTSSTITSMGLGGNGSINLAGGIYTMGGYIQTGAASVTQGAATINASGMILGIAPTAGKTVMSGSPLYTMDHAQAVMNITGAGNLQIGRNGKVGTFDLKQGTLTVGGNLITCVDYTSTGTFKIEGGTASVGGNLLINNGNGGGTNNKIGTVSIAGGTLSATGILFGNTSAVTFGSSSAGALTMTGGNLYVGAGGISEGISHPVTDTIALSGGTVGATANWSSPMAMTLATTNGNVTFRAADANNVAHQITLSGTLSGAGGLIKTGAGVLQLSGSNSYQGTTTINEGTLLLASAGALQGATGGVVIQGGSLRTSGDAILGGSINMTGGQLNISDTGGVGTLTLAAGKNFTMSGGVLSETISGDSACDTITGTGALTITGGTLDLLNSSAIQYGNSYQLFSGFSQINIDGLSIVNYDKDHYVAMLGSDGVLSFAPAVPEAASLGLLAAGGAGLWLRRRR